MFTLQGGFRRRRRKPNLSIPWLWRANDGNLHVSDINNPNRPESAKPDPGDSQASGSWLGPSLLVKGEISGGEDLLIDGSVEGTVCLTERKP